MAEHDQYLQSKGYHKSSSCWIKDGKGFTTVQALWGELKKLYQQAQANDLMIEELQQLLIRERFTNRQTRTK